VSTSELGGELPGVAEQVIENDHQEARVTVRKSWARHVDDDIAVRFGKSQALYDGTRMNREIDRVGYQLGERCARARQECIDELLRANQSFGYSGQGGARIRMEQGTSVLTELAGRSEVLQVGVQIVSYRAYIACEHVG
jgi:hypothetical protein